MLLLLGQVNTCQVMRAATANAFSFSSAEKTVNKRRQPKQWADLEESLTLQYRQRVAQMAPGVHDDDGYIITPDMRPVIYEQGLNLEPLEDPHLWPY